MTKKNNYSNIKDITYLKKWQLVFNKFVGKLTFFDVVNI